MNLNVNKGVITYYFCGRSGHTKTICYRTNGFLKQDANLMEARRLALIVEKTITLVRLVIRSMAIIMVTNFIIKLGIFIFLNNNIKSFLTFSRVITVGTNFKFIKLVVSSSKSTHQSLSFEEITNSKIDSIGDIWRFNWFDLKFLIRRDPEYIKSILHLI